MTVTVDELVAQCYPFRVDHDERYLQTRYPWTYSCDFLRLYPHVIPVPLRMAHRKDHGNGALVLSRADGSIIRQMWAESEGVSDHELAVVLADAYLAVVGILKDHDFDYEVIEGRVVVSGVRLVVNHSDVVVYEIELHSKYPESVTYAITDTDIAICISSGENTLNTDDSTDLATDVRFRFSSTFDWTVITEHGPSTVYVCVYRRKRFGYPA